VAIKDDVARHERILSGNGSDGLVTEVALLKARQTEMLWWMRSIGLVVILFVLNNLLGLIDPSGLSSQGPREELRAAVATLQPMMTATPRPTDFITFPTPPIETVLPPLPEMPPLATDAADIIFTVLRAIFGN